MSHGESKETKQAFTKVLAAGLAVFSAVPVLQSFIPEVEATSVSETVKDVKTVGKRKENSEESGSSDAIIIGLGIAAASGIYNIIQSLHNKLLSKENKKLKNTLNNVVPSVNNYDCDTGKIFNMSITNYLKQGLDELSLEEHSCNLEELKNSDNSPLFGKALKLRDDLIEYCSKHIKVFKVLAQYLISADNLDRNLFNSLSECFGLFNDLCKVMFITSVYYSFNNETFEDSKENPRELVEILLKIVESLKEVLLKLKGAETNCDLYYICRCDYFTRD